MAKESKVEIPEGWVQVRALRDGVCLDPTNAKRAAKGDTAVMLRQDAEHVARTGQIEIVQD